MSARVQADNPSRALARSGGPWRRGLRSGALVAFTCALGMALALLSPAAADAGSYAIADCPSATGHTTVTGPWHVFGQTPATSVSPECNDPVHALYFGIAELPTTPIGFRASTAGTALSLVGARIWWRAFGSPSDEVEAEREVFDASGELLEQGQFEGSGEIAEEMWMPEEFHWPASDHASTIELAEHCKAGGKCPMTESFGVGIELLGAELTVSDEADPAVSVTSVRNEGPGTFSGPISTTYTASDPDAGILRTELLLDGAPIAAHYYGASCSYTKLEPCPGSISDAYGGIVLPEGGHELAIRVTDAAGNATVTPLPHLANGVPCPGPTFALLANGKPAGVTIPYGQSVTIEGHLGCGNTPITGAAVQLSADSLAGMPFGLGPVLTGSDGSFRYQLPPGPSRELTFGYRAYSNEPGPTTQARLQITVHPRMTLHISPRRTQNRRTIKWRGRIEGGPYPAAGMPVLVQVKEARRWQTFDELIVHNGEVDYEYTFLRTRHPTTYTFRDALPTGGDVGYPYAASASAPVSVYVGPRSKRRGHRRKAPQRPRSHRHPPR
jgi:hypothetical protein